MPLLAKRVNALATSSTWTSVSSVIVDFARRRTASTMRRRSRSGRSSVAALLSSFIGLKMPSRCAHCESAPAKPRGLCPQCPVIESADSITGIPELGGNTAVARIFQHADFLSAFDFPADFGGKLKLVTAVIDRPRAICLHENSVVGVGDQLVVVPGAGEQTDIGHSNDGEAVPAFGAHGSGRAVESDQVRSFAIG